MTRTPFALTSVLLIALLIGTSVGVAQEAPAADAIDAENPPPGFVVPRPDGPRDVSMAKYARESFLDGEEGVVRLRLLVRRDGSVAEAQVAMSSGSLRLDQAATDLVQDWRYQPATLNGTTVDAWIPVEIIWALQTLRFDITAEHTRRMSDYYPRTALQLRQQGVSTVRFLVMPDGRVAKAFIDKPSGYRSLDNATLNMVMTGWRFTPGAMAGKEAVGGWFRVALAWVLPGAVPLRDTGSCGEPRRSTTADAIIAACTEFLTMADVTPLQRAEAYQTRGIALREKRDFDQAIADFNAAIRISPGLATLFIARARTRLAQGNRELAFADLDSALQVEPASFNVYTARGNVYFDAGQVERAVAEYNTAVRIAPTQSQPFAYNDRCYFLARIGRAQNALADCDRAVSLSPRSAAILDSRGYAYLRLGEFERAIRDYDAAIRLNPRLAVALFGRGVAKLRLGDARGQADITAATEIEPGITEQMSKLGVVP